MRTQVHFTIKKDWLTPNSNLFAAKVIIWLLSIAAGFYLVSEPNLIIRSLGILINGLMFAHGVELQHQALHNTGFRNRQLNKWIGIALGLPMLVAFSAYKKQHLHHHMAIGTKNDMEFFNRNSTNEIQSLATIVKFIFLSRPSIKALSRIFLSTHIALNEYTIMRYLIIFLSFTSIYLNSSFLFWGWLLPFLLISEPIHNLIELPEHQGCNINSRNIFKNTRSIRSNKIAAWYTNGNNFHVEHHLFPAVPAQNLLFVHQLINSKLINYKPTYFEYFFSLSKRNKVNFKTNVMDQL